MSRSPFFQSEVAKSTPYDNTTSGLTATDVQAAIDELKSSAASSASPGFSFGRSGNIPASTYLLNETVPSNKAGRNISLYNAYITEIWSNNEDVNTYTVELYSHDGNEINLTLLTTLTITAARSGSLSTNVSVAYGKQIAAKIGSGSAKNVLCGLIVKGTLTP
jgi:hypothetical protein